MNLVKKNLKKYLDRTCFYEVEKEGCNKPIYDIWYRLCKQHFYEMNTWSKSEKGYYKIDMNDHHKYLRLEILRLEPKIKKFESEVEKLFDRLYEKIECLRKKYNIGNDDANELLWRFGIR